MRERDAGPPRRLNNVAKASQLVALVLATGCSLFESPSPSTCAPACDGRACGDDGCGGVCGKCLPGSACDQGLCIQATEDCSFDCAALSLNCGERCGTSCGTCGAGQTCVDYQCQCAPSCAGKSCEDNDGCGGTCGPCPAPVSCEDCTLKLVRLTDELIGGARFVTLGVDFAAEGASATVGMADLRLQVRGEAKLERVGLAPSLISAGKELLAHPYTGQPFQELPGGSYRIVITSPHASKIVPTGRWLFLRFRVAPVVTERPVQFRLLREGQVLAPLSADEGVSASSFDGAVVLPLGLSDG